MAKALLAILQRHAHWKTTAALLPERYSARALHMRTWDWIKMAALSFLMARYLALAAMPLATAWIRIVADFTLWN